MNKQWIITQEAFDALLGWLDADRNQAGRRYEDIRRRLIKVFTCRGCHDADDLADETINRVVAKIDTLTSGYIGDPALYFYGVAQKVHLEYLRRPKAVPSPTHPHATETDEVEREYECLERCMGRLPAQQREMVLLYYREDKQAKIDHRKELAEKLGIAVNALRIRAHRIRATLQECVQKCVEQTATG